MSWLKSRLILLSVAIVWLLAILVMSPVQLPVTIMGAWFKPIRNYRYKLWISQDQLVNAIHNGNPDITVSSRIGWMAEQGSKTAASMAVVVDWLFYYAVGQKNHCSVSIERDEDHTL